MGFRNSEQENGRPLASQTKLYAGSDQIDAIPETEL